MGHGGGARTGRGRLATTPVKPLKILRRPVDAPPGAPVVAPALTPTARAASGIAAAVEAALERERERLERVYAAREAALVKAVSDMLSDALPRAVDAAASREASALVSAVAGLPQHQRRPAADPAAVRAAFAAAFATAALPKMQEATRGLLSSLSSNMDAAVDAKVARPVQNAANAAAAAAQRVASARYAVKDAASALSSRAAPDPAAEVRTLVEAGQLAEALRKGIGAGGNALMIAVFSAVATDVDSASEVLKDASLSQRDTVEFIAALAGSLDDRSDARLSWIYEILSSADEIGTEIEEDAKAACKAKLEDAIANLKEFAARSNQVTKDMAKNIKLMVHILNAHLTTM